MAKRAKAATILEDAKAIAMPVGPKINHLAPSPKELVEYNEKLVDYIVREVGKGRSLITVCEPDGMPHHVTFLRWCWDRPDLAERYSFAKRARAHGRIEQVEAITDWLDPETTDKTTAYVADIKAKNLVRLAEIGDPASFSPRMQHQHQHGGAVINVTMDLTGPQAVAESRPTIDATASQVPETHRLNAPHQGEGEGK